MNIGAGEMLLIAIVLLVAVGPEQLPGLVRKIGKTAGELKTMSDRVREEFMSGVNQLEEAVEPKTWTDKLEIPWTDTSDWAKKIDPPFTARAANSEGEPTAGEPGSTRAEPTADDGDGDGGAAFEVGRPAGVTGESDADVPDAKIDVTTDGVEDADVEPASDEAITSNDGAHPRVQPASRERE